MSLSKVAVVGCGMMGRGIVEVCAAAGMSVVAIKATPGDLNGPKSKIRESLDRRVKRGKMTPEQVEEVLARIRFTTELGEVGDADLVIESAVEALDAKCDILQRIEVKMHPEAVLGTNTSSLKLEKLADGLKHGGRFLGLHFFSPVPAMELVELGSIDRTAPYALQRCIDFCIHIGKTPVPLKASPGYVVNRLLVPYLLHAIETFESGMADAQAIDTAMKLGCGYPMGPLALADLIGLDVVHAMAVTLAEELGDSRYRRPKLLDKLVQAKQLGRKSKRGIYDYSGPEPVVNPDIRR
jgi:3-hydroxybutyryl-CoA dehydrogenase